MSLWTTEFCAGIETVKLALQVVFPLVTFYHKKFCIIYFPTCLISKTTNGPLWMANSKKKITKTQRNTKTIKSQAKRQTKRRQNALECW